MTKVNEIKIEERKINKPKIVKNEDGSYSNTSTYARCFNSSCTRWNEDPMSNLFYLKQTQNYANDLLKIRKGLLLNDVYDMLGMTRSKEGAIVGWVYDENNPTGDNYVDFGIIEEYNRDFLRGIENWAILDFNVDGMVFDKLLDIPEYWEYLMREEGL